MIKIFWKNVLRFVFLVLLQGLLLIKVPGTPYLYILFILLLPFETPGWLLIVLGFSLGISIDIFYNTYGLHAATTVFAAYLRPVILSSIAPRDGYDQGSLPKMSEFGFWWFLKYSLLIVVIHHTMLSFLHEFSFSGFINNWLDLIISIVFTVFLIILSQLFSFKK